MWLLFLSFAGSAQINISNTQSAALLAQKLTGQGVTILNPVLTCDYFGAGTFKVVSSNLGLDSGILLSTGNVNDVSGYESVLASSRLSAPGDPQLTSLARATTYDACRLEFDVIPKDDSLRFEYVFGSEEYNNATCGPYNDAFAFFISGPGISGQQNMALVPGTSIPVAVNSINNGVPGPQGNISNCTSMGAGSPFTSYYVDNTGGTTIAYKGFTKVLRAVHAVHPCQTYHLRLTIADAGNGLYDSGVFLKAGSLRTATYNISSVSSTGVTPAVMAPGCSARVTIKRSEKKPMAQGVHYIIAGSAISGTDYSAIADSAVIPAGDTTARFTINALNVPINGPKTLKLYLLDPYSCSQQPAIVDSTTVTLFDAPAVSILTPDTAICVGDAISLRARGTTGLIYSWSPASISGPNTIAPIARPSVATRYFVVATLPGSGCRAASDSVEISVMQGPRVVASADTQICTGASLKLVAKATPPTAGYNYSWIRPDSTLMSDSALAIFYATKADSGRYIVKVLGNANTCFGKDTVNVMVKPLPSAPKVISPLELCVNEQTGPLRVDAYSQLWYTDSAGGAASAIAPTPLLSAAGAYHYYVSSITQGCESKRARIDVAVINCCGSELLVPTAITPNGDGRNDYFSILRGAEGTGVDIQVFNRWGQTVFHGTGSDRWDGTQHGQPVLLGTYYYIITLDCRNGNVAKHKGEITVLR